MDRSWIQIRSRRSNEYIKGVEEFMKVARAHTDGRNRTRCPCRKCNNVDFKHIDDVRYDLYKNGMDRTYTVWVHHGEQFEMTSEDDDDSMSDEEESSCKFDQGKGKEMAPPVCSQTIPVNHSQSDVPRSSRPLVRRHTDVSSIASSSSKQGRGRARGLTVSKMLETTGVRPRIEFPLGKYRPVDGEFGPIFASEVGVICRQFAPFTCKNWTSVSQVDKEVIHQRILSRIDIDLHLDNVKKGVNKYLGARFRGYKNRLHNYVNKHGGPASAQARACPYDSISQEDWLKVCDNFLDPNFQKKSETNKVNRSRLRTNHCSGSKPFVRVRHEMRDPETQEEPDMIEVYRKTHYKVKGDGTGSWVTPQCQAYYDEMTRRRTQEPNRTADEICSTVLGSRSEYVRDLGNGKIPNSLQSSQQSRAEVEEARRRAEHVEQRAIELAQQVQSQQQMMEAQQQRMDRMDSIIQELMSRLSPGDGDQPSRRRRRVRGV